jgi:hypothetical protein
MASAALRITAPQFVYNMVACKEETLQQKLSSCTNPVQWHMVSITCSLLSPFAL